VLVPHSLTFSCAAVKTEIVQSLQAHWCDMLCVDSLTFVFKTRRQTRHVREGRRESFHGVYQIMSSAECMRLVRPSGAVVTARYLSGYHILAVFNGDLPGNVLAVSETTNYSLSVTDPH
jgi:hypothetical protein